MIYENYEKCGGIVAEIELLEEKLAIVNSKPIVTVKYPYEQRTIGIDLDVNEKQDFGGLAEDFIKEMQLNILNRIDGLKVDLLKL